MAISLVYCTSKRIPLFAQRVKILNKVRFVVSLARLLFQDDVQDQHKQKELHYFRQILLLRGTEHTSYQHENRAADSSTIILGYRLPEFFQPAHRREIDVILKFAGACHICKCLALIHPLCEKCSRDWNYSSSTVLR